MNSLTQQICINGPLFAQQQALALIGEVMREAMRNKMAFPAKLVISLEYPQKPGEKQSND